MFSVSLVDCRQSKYLTGINQVWIANLIDIRLINLGISKARTINAAGNPPKIVTRLDNDDRSFGNPVIGTARTKGNAIRATT